ncbi:MAG TPA: hypothetical protein VGY54_25920, partial [Polyangiaceae bacterium]|nr:hypothetical protein [Polyangiaceae bacterium]
MSSTSPDGAHVDKTALIGQIAFFDVARLVFGVVAAFGTASVIAIQIWLAKLNAGLNVIKDAEAAGNRKQLAEYALAIEEARASAAEANEKAEAERLERVKIEKRLAPRSLTDIIALVGTLRPFAGTAVLIVYPPEPEPAALGHSIDTALTAAGILCNVQTLTGMGVAVSGIVVTVAPRATENERRASIAIADA